MAPKKRRQRLDDDQLVVRQIVLQAKHRWLRPAEICEILRNHTSFCLSDLAHKPESGALFLYDREVRRSFRKDGYRWKKTKDGKAVKEAHERLKIYRKVLDQQRGAMEEEMKMGLHANFPNISSSMHPTISFSIFHEQETEHHHRHHLIIDKKANDAALEVLEKVLMEDDDEQAMEMKESSTYEEILFGKDKFPELLVPKMSMDWTRDPFWAPMNSPWLLHVDALCGHSQLTYASISMVTTTLLYKI